MPTMPGYCGSTLEKRAGGPGASRAASIVKWGNAQTGMLMIVRSGRVSASRLAMVTASSLVQTTSGAVLTSCPSARRAAAARVCMLWQNSFNSEWTDGRPSETVMIAILLFALIGLLLVFRRDECHRSCESVVRTDARCDAGLSLRRIRARGGAPPRPPPFGVPAGPLLSEAGQRTLSRTGRPPPPRGGGSGPFRAGEDQPQTPSPEQLACPPPP